MEQMTKDSILYLRHNKYFEKYGYNEKSVERWIKTESVVFVCDYIAASIIIVYLIYN